MSSKTVSLEASAYERLRAAKAPHESFTQTVNRLLARDRPSCRELAGFFTASEAEGVRSAIRRMRAAEAPAEKLRISEWGRQRGARPRH